MKQSLNFNRLTKRRLATEEECMYDLRDELEKMFYAFYQAVENFNKEIVLTPPQARARAFEATLLNSKMIHSIQNNFPQNWKFGRYKRFLLAVKGYIVLFKKLDSKNLPMNITTNAVSAINNQQQLSFFGESDSIVDPILYFGYRKNRVGNISDPKLVYVDENKLQWTITESSISTSKVINIELEEQIIEQPKINIRPEKLSKIAQNGSK